MQILEMHEKKEKYDITGFGYVCQVCGYKVQTRPPQWCPVCKNHKVIFKRTPL